MRQIEFAVHFYQTVRPCGCPKETHFYSVLDLDALPHSIAEAAREMFPGETMDFWRGLQPVLSAWVVSIRIQRVS